LEVETSGYAFASATTLWRTRPPIMRAVTTGGAALTHHAAPTRGKGAAPPCATSSGARFPGGSKGGRAIPRRPLGYTRGKLARRLLTDRKPARRTPPLDAEAEGLAGTVREDEDRVSAACQRSGTWQAVVVTSAALERRNRADRSTRPVLAILELTEARTVAPVPRCGFLEAGVGGSAHSSSKAPTKARPTGVM